LYEDGVGFTWDIAVYPGADRPDNPFGGQFAENWWVPDAWVDTGGDPLYDWGVIKMPDTDYGNTLGWLPVVAMTTGTLERADFMPAISGYPGDQVDGTQWFDQENAFSAVNDFTLDYVIDTAAGQSGAAIFSNNLAEDFGGAIVGVHAYGGTTSNSGSRIDEELLGDILTGCDEMGCTIEAYLEGGPTITPGPLTWQQGDANCSGGLDVGDIAALIRMAVDGSIPVGCATYQDDVNCLNGTDAVDALGVAIYLAEADPLPVNGNCTPIGGQLSS
jgi:predicted outer membrane repeat protein